MSLTEKQCIKLIKIVRHHAVYFGGGISSKDAGVREECDHLIMAIEKLTDRARKASSKSPSKSFAQSKVPADAGASKKKTPGTYSQKKTNKKQIKAPSQAKNGKKAESISTLIKRSAVESLPGVEPLKKKTGLEDRPQPRTKRNISAVHLFDAYNKGKFPTYGGYILSSFFTEGTNYTVFEITGYDNVQDIYLEPDALVFKSAGCKLYALVEPASFPKKSVEPYQRKTGKKIPYRFSELHSLKTKKHDIIYIAKEPIVSYSSFTIIMPKRNDFSVLFYNVSTIFQNIQDFLISVLNKETFIPKADAAKAAKLIINGVRNFHAWLDL